MDDLNYIQEPSALAGILAKAKELEFTRSCDHRTGALLRVLAASKPGGRLLELGTGIGVGSAWLLAGMDAKATLVSIDVEEDYQNVARQALGADKRATFIVQDAASYLWRIPPGSFDVVFADANAGKYVALEEALGIVRPGGFFIVDDMLPGPNWPEGHDVKAADLLERLSAEPDFQLVRFAWASGVIVAVKKWH
jgi:predicted O-methyltransferase YrrM